VATAHTRGPTDGPGETPVTYSASLASDALIMIKLHI